MTQTPAAPPPFRRSWMRDGLWIAVLGVLIIAAGTLWQIYGSLEKRRATGVKLGDTIDPATYGFDLDNLRVSPNLLVTAGVARDAVPALIEPQPISVAEVERINTEEHGKYLVPTDRVIGVSIEGEARAYPLLVMNWHEVVNDTLGGAPICVTYHGLSDSAVVLDRRYPPGTGEGDEALEFGVSGLLHNSNLLLFDRRDEPRQSSLWSQLLAVPLAGPLGAEPAPAQTYPAQVMQWRDWLALHPETTVLAREVDMTGNYKQDVFGPYFQTDEIRYPVDPQLRDIDLNDLELRLKSRLLGLSIDGEPWAVPHERVLSFATYDADGLGTWQADVGGHALTLHCRAAGIGFAPETVWLESSAGIEVVAPCVLQFAWHAHYPGTHYIAPGDTDSPPVVDATP